MTEPSGDRDLALDPADGRALRDACVRLLPSQSEIVNLLEDIEYPRESLPVFRISSAGEVWGEIFRKLENGVIPTPWGRLLGALAWRFWGDVEVRRLAQEHLGLTRRPRRSRWRRRPRMVIATSALVVVAAAPPGRLTIPDGGPFPREGESHLPLLTTSAGVPDSAAPPPSSGPPTTTSTSSASPPTGPSRTPAPRILPSPERCTGKGNLQQVNPSPNRGDTPNKSNEVTITGAAYELTPQGDNLLVDVEITFGGNIPDGNFLYLYTRMNKVGGVIQKNDNKYLVDSVVQGTGCWRWDDLDAGRLGAGYASLQLFPVLMDAAAKQRYVDGSPGDILATEDLDNVGEARWTSVYVNVGLGN
ncbi:hypothetical protein I6A81_16630 [Frankia sp. CN7]|uniref:effector-associated domain EAD1-containing protein n=1 Tax=Frankia nepalensis TaxID=1836974 RepID=UPI001933D29E|nr:effector-associated domain EAD1-containing protein [Frankia nepalensis]MBL7497839.1 hypothetical protein [Frankia nepalensis]